MPITLENWFQTHLFLIINLIAKNFETVHFSQFGLVTWRIYTNLGDFMLENNRMGSWLQK